MSIQTAFPVLKIHGERDSLLAPYRHAVGHLRDALIPPGDESALKAPALRGSTQAAVTAWDAAFATLGLRWATRGPRSATDPFLAAGGIEPVIPSALLLASGEAGGPASGPTAAPLFALAEWEHYRLRADKARLEHAFALLWADFQWREEHQRRRNGLVGGAPEPYQLHATGRFMLGGRVVPSLAGGAYWVDACGMYALNARLLAEMARVLGRKLEAAELDWALRDLAAKVNARMWSEQDGWYHDLDEHGVPMPMKTLAAAWLLWTGIAPRNRAEQMLKRLCDPTWFERAHPFSTVAATEGEYRRRDGTPVGVARPDFNLVALEGLCAFARHADAHRAAEAHLRRAAKVLADSGELYLAYDPDRDTPMPLSDGSSGADSPLALALMPQLTLGYLIGLRPNAQRGELELVPELEERFTVEDMQFGFGVLNFEVAAKDPKGGRRAIDLMCDVPLKLRVRAGESTQVHELKPGMHTVQA
jgi:hypothetical protein